MEYVKTGSVIDVINDQIEDRLCIRGYDLNKSGCLKEIIENLEKGMTSFDVEDDLSDQDQESINQCVAEVYNNCIIRSARDLRIKMSVQTFDEELTIVARLFDAADHSEYPSYETKIVIENEFWTLEEFRRWIAQDLWSEEEIELEFEEALDQFAETRDADLIDYSVNISLYDID